MRESVKQLRALSANRVSCAKIGWSLVSSFVVGSNATMTANFASVLNRVTDGCNALSHKAFLM